MDENERNHLLKRIRELEQSNRRWKIATVSFVVVLLAAALGSIMLGGISLLTSRTAMLRAEEEARRQAAEAMELEMRAREDAAAAAAASRQELEKLRKEKEKSD